jgi:predicted RNase H-like nuclease (RuvC/YqgF family)
MHDLLNNAGFVALMGTIFGGAGLKIIEHQLGRAKARAADAAGIREELRKQIEDLRAELVRAEAEEQRLQGLVEELKDKYWTYRETAQKEINQLIIEVERLRRREEGKS